MNIALINLIKMAQTLVPTGASCEGNLEERIRLIFQVATNNEKLAEMKFHILPGDHATIGTINQSLGSPIGYDVWYLWHTANALPSTSDGSELQEEVLEGMSEFFENFQNIKPLRTLRQAGDLSAGMSMKEAKSYFENNGLYMVKEMRFEQNLKGNSFKYPSGGKERDFVAYLAFPTGQLGVMEVQSLISETMIEREEIEDDTAVIQGGEFMPPVKKERNACPGTHIIHTGYVKGDQEKVEYVADKFIGHENYSPHRWERVWIKNEDTWPVPGEFVGLACRSFPWHAWWFQETFPFLYSGNWFETGYYASGLITEIYDPADDILIDQDNLPAEVIAKIEDAATEETYLYKIRIRGLELCLRPSDFAGYSVGDRVAVLKKNGETTNFDWSQMDSWPTFEEKKIIVAGQSGNETEIPVVSCENLMIIPITFYEGI
jgi:hypothetical protein